MPRAIDTLQSGPVKASALEPFAANPESASVPKKVLEACARGVGKGEEMAGKNLLAEAGAYQCGKAVKALAHVGGARNQKDAGGRTCGDHNAPWWRPEESVRSRS